MKTYWAWWASLSFLFFIVPELYAAFTNPQNTLSWTVWDVEGFQPGQPITAWTATHILIGGVLCTVLLWLIGHLVFGLWRRWYGN